MKVVLENLGFETFLVGGQVGSVAVPNNHAVTIVKLRSAAGTETTYLIDVGIGRPIVGPVNLSDLPQRRIEAGYEIEYRFNAEKSRYERILLNGCPLKGPMVRISAFFFNFTFIFGGNWQVFGFQEPEYLHYFFQLVPFDFPDFKPMLIDMFTDSSKCFFLNLLFVFRFTRLESSTDYEFVAFRGKTLVRGTALSRTEFKYSSYMEMFPVVTEWFPKVNHEKLRAALCNYDDIAKRNLRWQ